MPGIRPEAAQPNPNCDALKRAASFRYGSPLLCCSDLLYSSYSYLFRNLQFVQFGSESDLVRFRGFHQAIWVPYHSGLSRILVRVFGFPSSLRLYGSRTVYECFRLLKVWFVFFGGFFSFLWQSEKCNLYVDLKTMKFILDLLLICLIHIGS